MPKHVVLSDVCHQLLKVRAARMGVSMGAAVLSWLSSMEAPSVSGGEPPPVVPGGTWVARCPVSWDVGSVRSRCDLPAGHAGACDAGAPLAMLPAEVRAKAFTGPFSKAAQMGKKP